VARWSEQEQAWIILSELFLDTDIAGLVPSIVQRLMALPINGAALQGMLVNDVYPVCGANLRSVAGIWQGFDPDTLVVAIHEHRLRGGRFAGVRRMWRRRRVMRDVPQWRVVRHALAHPEL